MCSELVGASRYSGLTTEFDVFALRFSQKLQVCCGATGMLAGLNDEELRGCLDPVARKEPNC